MSHFANALSNLLIETNKTATELSRTSGINEAQISRMRNGLQVWVAGEDMVHLANGFYPGNLDLATKAHAKLLCAHLHDECQGSGAKFISIQLNFEPSLTQSPLEAYSHQPALPPKVQRSLEVISNHLPENRPIRDMIEALADFCQSKLSTTT